jgi:hypothetical protein
MSDKKIKVVRTRSNPLTIKKSSAADERTAKNRQFVIECVYTSTIAGIVHTINKIGTDNVTVHMMNKWGRNIGNSMYDIKAIWSGYISLELKALVDAGAKLNKVKCNEHYHSRQLSGENIIRHIMQYGGISREKFTDMINLYTQVHYVTSAENIALRPSQKKGVFVSWHHAYNNHNVKLVHHEDGNPHPDMIQYSKAA